MAKQIFVNLPVKDLKKSMEFFRRLGFTFNMQFTNDDAACMVISENIFVMLLVEKFFVSFTKKDIPDSRKGSEVIVAISADNRGEVDNLVANAKAAGATISMETQDQGWMYTRGFQDLDGHLWEFSHMDLAALQR